MTDEPDSAVGADSGESGPVAVGADAGSAESSAAAVGPAIAEDVAWVSPPQRGRGFGADGSATRAGRTGEPRGSDADASDLTGPIDSAEHAARVLRWRQQSRQRNAERRVAFEGKPKGRRKYPWWVELPVLIVIAFLVTFLVQTFVARVYYVPSGSMETTLHGVEHGGDRILAYKLGYTFGSPEQGDVVVFKGPPSWVPEAAMPGPTTMLGKLGQALGAVVGIAPPNEKDFVKRVIAVGGQTISCCDDQGRVQVNGTSLNEPYLFMDVANHPNWDWIPGESSCEIDPMDPTRFRSLRCFGPYTVPEGTVWVMGDHRSDSADSTYNCRGLVPSESVQCQGPVPISDVIGRAVAIVMPPSRWGGVGSPDIMAPAPSQDPPPTSGTLAPTG